MAQRRSKAAAEERKRRADDLRALGESLLNSAVCEDISPLQSAAHQCQTTIPASADWSYDVTLLRFRLPKLAGGKPSDISGVVATLNVSSSGTTTSTQNGDPLSYSAVDLVLTGNARYGSESGTATAAWHFDRHVGGEHEPVHEPHPLYHVQYGGRRMLGVDLGRTLLSDAPRLLHPPMDVVLAVDLVVSNFMCEAWNRLSEDPAYVRIVDNSYRRLWRPWFSFVASFWEQHAHLRWNELQRLCPTVPKPLVPSFAQVPASNILAAQRNSRTPRRRRK